VGIIVKGTNEFHTLRRVRRLPVPAHREDESAIILFKIEGQKIDGGKDESEHQAPAARQTLETIHQQCCVLLVGQLRSRCEPAGGGRLLNHFATKRS